MLRSNVRRHPMSDYVNIQGLCDVILVSYSYSWCLDPLCFMTYCAFSFIGILSMGFRYVHVFTDFN